MALIKKLLGIFTAVFLFNHAVYAILPVVISGPDVAIQSSIAPGNTQTAHFTVTNNLPQSISIQKIDGVSGFISESNNCGSSLSSKAQCSITLVIAPTFSDMDSSVTQHLNLFYGGRVPAQSPSFTVAVPHLNSISATSAGSYAPKNQTQQFTATGNYSDGSTANITTLSTWSSSNASIATVTSSGSSAGLATGVNYGSVTITATAASVASNAATLIVPVIVGPTGDFSDIQTAINNSAVQDGNVMQLQAATFNISSLITVNKQLTIMGAGAATVVQNSADIGSLFTITNNNVTLEDFTLKHLLYASSSPSDDAAIKATSQSGLKFSHLSIQQHKFGITIANGTNSTVSNNDFSYAGPTNNNNREIALYGNAGTSLIQNNTFTPSPNSPSFRGTIFLYLDTTGSGTFSGTVNASNNTQEGSNLLRQFFNMLSFAGTTGSFSLISNNNIFHDNVGSYIFFTGTNKPLDLFSSISMNNNHDESTTSEPDNGYKGLITFDGTGGPFDVATNPNAVFTSLSGNVLATTSITAPAFTAAASGGLIGYNPLVFNPFTINTFSLLRHTKSD